MSPQFEALYLRHAVSAYARQLALAQVIGERGWGFSMDSGQLVFGGEEPSSAVTFAAQLLGTASEASNSWLWSWANNASRIPPALVQDALRLRATNDRGSVDDRAAPPEWSEAQFSLDFENADDHRLCMVACGALNGDAYYRGPYEGGAAFFLLRDERLRSPTPDTLRVVSVFTQAVASLPLRSHRAAFLGYLSDCHLVPQVEGASAIRVEVQGRPVIAQFDESERLTKLEGTS